MGKRKNGKLYERSGLSNELISRMNGWLELQVRTPVGENESEIFSSGNSNLHVCVQI